MANHFLNHHHHVTQEAEASPCASSCVVRDAIGILQAVGALCLCAEMARDPLVCCGTLCSHLSLLLNFHLPSSPIPMSMPWCPGSKQTTTMTMSKPYHPSHQSAFRITQFSFFNIQCDHRLGTPIGMFVYDSGFIYPSDHSGLCFMPLHRSTVGYLTDSFACLR